ncbi:MAG TPA: citrate (Si)-synthase, partial [Fluviicoccus sp.]|nr:citrate (Si)-synthase [Fluviicoccus sp.]
MSGKKATLTIGDKSLDLPVHSGTMGPDVIDVKDVLSNGYFTYDPGFMA